LIEKVIAAVRRETPSAVGRANKRGAASQEDGPGRRPHRASR
jgi:hypothetical protein